METPVHDLARRQSGVLLVSQLHELLPRRAVARLLVSEAWQQITPVAYLAPEAKVTAYRQALAWQLRYPDLVACRRLAAAILDLDGIAARLDFTNSRHRRRLADARVHREVLQPDDIIQLGAVRLTSPSRTVADLMRHESTDLGVIAIDSALRRRLVTLEAVAAELEQLTGARGSRHAWRAFRHADPRAESVLESLARLRMHEAGLYPQTQVSIGRGIRADFVIGPVIIETEGTAYHGGVKEHNADVHRFNALAVAGNYKVLRFTWRDVRYHPELMIDAIWAALRA